MKINGLTGTKLPRRLYSQDAATLAPLLLGKIVVHNIDGHRFTARIVETEAYVGEHDLACHAAKGRTARTEILYGDPGYAYVYLIYGMYDMLNVVCAPNGTAQAILIRAAEPLTGFDEPSAKLLCGPGKLCKAMHIKTRRDNGLDLLGDELFILDAPPPAHIQTTVRVGVDYAGDWKDAPLRYYDADSRSVSRLPRAAHKR